MDEPINKRELSAFLMNIDLKHNIVTIDYMGRKITIAIYVCRGEESSLDKEVDKLAISPSDPVAIIPATMIHSLWQIIFGVLNYVIIREYRPNTYEKFKNKGLFLSMLITGLPQLSDVVKALKNEYTRSEFRYIIISLKDGFPVPVNCSDDISMLNFSLEPRHLIKNMNNYLKFL